jgi:hypothetical protein
MSVKLHLEQAVKSLESEREREVAIIKERVMRETIIPYNKEMDIARDKAIAELQNELNSNIAALQEEFARKKKEIFEANEKKKESNATSVITTESYTVTVKYDKAISKLNEQIADLKE